MTNTFKWNTLLLFCFVAAHTTILVNQKSIYFLDDFPVIFRIFCLKHGHESGIVPVCMQLSAPWCGSDPVQHMRVKILVKERIEGLPWLRVYGLPKIDIQAEVLWSQKYPQISDPDKTYPGFGPASGHIISMCVSLSLRCCRGASSKHFKRGAIFSIRHRIYFKR